MRYLILVIFLMSINQSFSQDCDVIADNNYIKYSQKEIQQELKYLENPNKEEPRVFMVTLHRVRATNGGQGIKQSFVTTAMNKLNEAYLESNIRFELCDEMTNIDNSKFTTLTFEERFELINTYNVSNTINIYFVPDVLNSSGDDICGNATFPSTEASQRRILMDNDCVTNGSTFIHEMGHYFNVLHTHTSFYGVERVERINCDNLGDGLCDTPADPRLSGSTVTNCTYTGNETDSYGDQYSPDVTNFMSYAPKSCRVSFTDEQRAVISIAANTSNDYHLSTCSLPDFSINYTDQNIEIFDFVDTDISVKLKSAIIFEESAVSYRAILKGIDFLDDIVLDEGELTFSTENRENNIDLSIPFSNDLYKFESIIVEIDLPNAFQEINESNNKILIPINHTYQNKGSLVLYPNPTHNDLSLFLNSNYQGTIEYRIFDISGKNIQNGQFSKQNKLAFESFNISNLTAGEYIINLTFDEETESIKFIKF